MLSEIDKILSSKDHSIEAKIIHIYKKAREQYGTDVGLLYIFIMNLVELKKGEGIFIKAGVPHAYIHGNIIECMANSDNVVRAGLTPKFKDIVQLTNILTYEYGKPEWNSENNECLLPLIGGLIDCSNDWCDNADSFELSYRYFIDGSRYVDDMYKLNEFLKRGDVMILSEMEIYK